MNKQKKLQPGSGGDTTCREGRITSEPTYKPLSQFPGALMVSARKEIPPWQRGALRSWAICGMNHYRLKGKKRLFVSMTKAGRCIVAEGPDTPAIWEKLQREATKPFTK